MGKIPKDLKEDIARNIRRERVKKFGAQRGMSKKCAEEFGVSPQQWSPWEKGMRTPDEERLGMLAEFFGVSKEYLRRTSHDYDLTYSQWMQGMRNQQPINDTKTAAPDMAAFGAEADRRPAPVQADAAGLVLKRRAALAGLAEKVLEVMESGIKVSVVLEKSEEKTATA